MLVMVSDGQWWLVLSLFPGTTYNLCLFCSLSMLFADSVRYVGTVGSQLVLQDLTALCCPVSFLPGPYKVFLCPYREAILSCRYLHHPQKKYSVCVCVYMEEHSRAKKYSAPGLSRPDITNQTVTKYFKSTHIIPGFMSALKPQKRFFLFISAVINSSQLGGESNASLLIEKKFALFEINQVNSGTMTSKAGYFIPGGVICIKI